MGNTRSEGIKLNSNFDQEYALLGLNKDDQYDFERGVNQIMRVLYIDSKDWLRNKLTSKPSFIQFTVVLQN